MMELKLGDKVAIYSHFIRRVGRISHIFFGVDASVFEVRIEKPGDEAGYDYEQVHRKVLRKITVRKKSPVYFFLPKEPSLLPAFRLGDVEGLRSYLERLPLLRHDEYYKLRLVK